MKAISLWQPWASAIAVGSKTIETRSWPTSYRGPLAIHAAKRCVAVEMKQFAATPHWLGALYPLIQDFDSEADIAKILPFGAIVATCNLVDCQRTEWFTMDYRVKRRRPEGEQSTGFDWCEDQMGDFGPGRFGWVLQNIRRLETPVPFRGAQGFFKVPDSLLTWPDKDAA